jgi:hypothetical protein
VYFLSEMDEMLDAYRSLDGQTCDNTLMVELMVDSHMFTVQISSFSPLGNFRSKMSEGWE